MDIDRRNGKIAILFLKKLFLPFHRSTSGWKKNFLHLFCIILTIVTMATTSKPSVVTIEQLSVQNPSYSPDPDDPSDKIPEEDILPSRPFDRNARPQSSRSIRSTTSRSSVNNLDGRVHCHDYHAQRFFSYRVKKSNWDEDQVRSMKISVHFSFRNKASKMQWSVFTRIFFLNRRSMMNLVWEFSNVRGFWLSSSYWKRNESNVQVFFSFSFLSIDHWDMHREVIIMLMDNHILIIRYNFIKEKIIYSQSISFNDIRSVLFGPLCYPDRSLMGFEQRSINRLISRWNSV